MKDPYLAEIQDKQAGFAVVDGHTARIVVDGKKVVVPAIVKCGHGFQIRVRPGVLLSAQFGRENFCARENPKIGDTFDMKPCYWSPTADVGLIEHGKFVRVWGAKGSDQYSGYTDPGVFVSIAILLASNNTDDTVIAAHEIQLIRYIVRHGKQPDKPERLVELLADELVEVCHG